jgi:DNA-binding response OmpR family regulator
MPKILVIDDGDNIREMLSDYLKNAGYDVVTAKDGEEGFQKFNESNFDLVITDFEMPRCNGNKVAEKIYNKTKNIPIIGMTATPSDFDRNYFNVIIEKPFTLDVLSKSIKSVIQNIKPASGI